jgi:hypothetical protein
MTMIFLSHEIGFKNFDKFTEHIRNLNRFLAFGCSCPILSVFLEKLLATASDVEVEDVDKDGDADEEWHR